MFFVLVGGIFIQLLGILMNMDGFGNFEEGVKTTNTIS